MKKKRILSLLLALLMVVSIIPFNIFAEGDPEPTPSEVEGTSEPTTEPVTDPPCDTCGAYDCGSEHLTWCADCRMDDCGKTHVFCEICQKNDCGQNHCPTCGTIDCIKEHKECDKCGTMDCTADHTNWCDICKADNCGKTHTFCETCQKYDCGKTHIAEPPRIPMTSTGQKTTKTQSPDYSDDVGKYVKLNEAIVEFTVYGLTPSTGSLDEQIFMHEDFLTDSIFQIAEWMMKDGKVWYRLTFYKGGLDNNSTFAQNFPTEPWFMQTAANELVFVDTCTVCGKPDCSGHTWCETCEEYDCGIDHSATEPTDPDTPTQPENPCGCCDACTGAEDCACACENCTFKPQETEKPDVSDRESGIVVSGTTFPADVTMSVDEADVSTLFAQYDIPVSKKVFGLDITLLQNGEEYQPGTRVLVKVPVNAAAGTKIGLIHNHNGAVSLMGMTEVLPDGTVEFYTDRFSEFAGFTVDFDYNGIDYSINGLTSIKLSELFAALEIDRDAAKVIDVKFSDTSLVSVTKLDGDWQLNSLQAFSTEETLEITFVNGEIITIDVTDAQTDYYPTGNSTYTVSKDYDTYTVAWVEESYLPITITFKASDSGYDYWKLAEETPSGAGKYSTTGMEKTSSISVTISEGAPIGYKVSVQNRNRVVIYYEKGPGIVRVYKDVTIKYLDGSAITTVSSKPGKKDIKLGTWGTSSGNLYYTHTIPSTTPSAPGYNFTGWKFTNNNNASQTAGANATVYLDGDSVSGENINFTAQWEKIPYVITYKNSDGTQIATQNYDVETSLTLRAAPTAPTGYKFNGWKLGTAEGSWSAGTYSESQNKGQKNYGNITLVAQWTERGDTAYTVEHYKQNLDGTYPSSTTETQNLKGTTGATLTVANFKQSFDGFTYKEGKVGGSVVTTTTILADGTRTINLYYTRNDYDVTVSTGTGIQSVSGGGSYKYGDTVPINATVSDGYTWNGWSVNSGNIATPDTQSDSFTMPANTVSLTANATPIQFSITYVLTDDDGVTGTNNPNNPSSYTVESSTITLKDPTPPTGYEFDKWNEGNTIPLGSSGNKTFTAVWKRAGYTVTYDANGGTNAPEPQTKTPETALTITTDVPTKTGCHFMGWAESPTAIEADYQSGGTYTKNEDITLYAVWGHMFDVSIVDANNAPKGGIAWILENGSETVWGNNATIWHVGALVNSKFEFRPTNGYTIRQITITTPGATETVSQTFTENQTYTYDRLGADGLQADTKIVVKVERTSTAYLTTTIDNNGKVEYELTDGTTGDMPQTRQEYDVGQYPDVKLIFTAAEGYLINKVNGEEPEASKVSANGTVYTYTIPSTGLPKGETVVDVTTVPSQYTVTYNLGFDGNANVQTNQADFPQQTKYYGVDLELYTTIPAATGYSFLGWDVNGDKKADYQPGGSYTENADLTLNAIWNPTPYEIKYVVEGLPDNLADDYAIQNGKYLDVVELYKFDFKGYRLVTYDVSAGTYDVNTNELTMPASDVTVTVVYTANDYTITFDTQGGSPIAPIKQAYGTAIAKPADPTKLGYTFAGWDMDIPATMPAENLTITARWTKIPYTISYNLDGGTLPAGQTNPKGYDVESPTFTLNNPTKPAHTFTGWTGSNGTTPSTNVTIPTGSTGARSYTANWTENTYTITYDHDYTDEEGNQVISTEDYTIISTSGLLNPTRRGYEFLGWKLETGLTPPNGNWTPGTYSAGTPVTEKYGDVTLVAQWKSTGNSLTYAYTGEHTPTDTSCTLPEEAIVTPDTEVTVFIPTAIGYTFSGWTPSVTSVQITEGKFQMPDEAVVLTGSWTPIPYKITYDYNNGDSTTPSKKVEATYTIKDAVKLMAAPAKADVPTDFRFTGWKLAQSVTAPNGNWTAGTFQADQQFQDGRYGNITLVAQWERAAKDLTIRANSTDSDVNFVYTISGQGITITVAVPANSSVTIKSMPVGDYTITEKTAWSWRHTDNYQNHPVTITKTEEEQSVVFDYDGNENKLWLNGYSYGKKGG